MGMGTNKPVRKLTGTGTTQGAARTALQTEIERLKVELRADAAHWESGERLSIRDACKGWLRSRRSLTEGTRSRYETVFKQVILGVQVDGAGNYAGRGEFYSEVETLDGYRQLARLDIAEVKPRLLKRLLDDVAYRTVEANGDETWHRVSYVKHAHYLLTKVCAWAASEVDLRNGSPMRDIPLPERPSGVASHATDALKTSDWDALREVIKTSTRAPHYLLPLFDFMSGTGVRLGEALAVRKRDVRNLNHPEVPVLVIAGRILTRPVGSIPSGQTGNYRAPGLKEDARKNAFRVIDNPAQFVVHALNEQVSKLSESDGDDALLFRTKTGQPLSSNNVRRSLRGLVKKAEIDGHIAGHSFRKMVLSILDEHADDDAATASQFAGHARVETTNKYYLLEKTRRTPAGARPLLEHEFATVMKDRMPNVL